MTNSTLHYKSAAQCQARINQLEARLSLPLSAEVSCIDEAWLKIDQLEKMLADKSGSKGEPTATTQAPPKAASPVRSVAVDPEKPETELKGFARAAAAQREGRTQKPTAALAVPQTGWGRAARAQEKLNQKNKS
jgi:hypothetical protein